MMARKFIFSEEDWAEIQEELYRQDELCRIAGESNVRNSRTQRRAGVD